MTLDEAKARIATLEREVRELRAMRERLWRLTYATFLAPHWPKGAKPK